MNHPSNTEASDSVVLDMLINGNVVTVDQALSIAIRQHQLEKYREAEAIYRGILRKTPSNVEVINNLSLLLLNTNRIDEAIALCRHLIHSNPEYSAAYNNLGYLLMSKGDREEAEKALRMAIALKPDDSQALMNLVMIRKYRSLDHEDVKHIQRLLKRDAPVEHSEALYFALGKIYDDCNCYDEAFAYYQKANQIVNGTISFNPAELDQFVQSIKATFHREFLTKQSAFGSLSSTPVFIVGMPRSGTTLLESTLSKHPSVSAAGELTTIMTQINKLPQYLGINKSFPEIAEHLTSTLISALASEYEAVLKERITSSAIYMIDKQPLNFWYLGFIFLLFPNAKVIHATRNPLPTCLSNYFQPFSASLTYAFDLQNIGHYYNAYVELMDYWKQVLPIEILEVSYEAMVKDAEATTKKAFSFLGLDWDERCLSPHEHAHIVKTASIWQVRQPIYLDALERWRHYEKYLDPLKNILALKNPTIPTS